MTILIIDGIPIKIGCSELPSVKVLAHHRSRIGSATFLHPG
jgi:hypothetical protein